MVDTVDSKSAARKGVRVQVPPGVQKKEEGLLENRPSSFAYRTNTGVASVDTVLMSGQRRPAAQAQPLTYYQPEPK